jgi:DNA-binding protein HU-beta
MAVQRAELADRIEQASGVPAREVTAVLTALTPVLAAAAAAGEEVRLPGLLTVRVSERAARTGRNPRTGETLEIPAGRVVRITPGATLKAAVD